MSAKGGLGTGVEVQGAVQVQAAELSRAVSCVHRAIAERTPVPMLAFLRIRADAGVVVLDGTDLGVSVRVELPAEMPSGFTAVVPARELSAMLAGTTGLATLSVEDEKFVVDVGLCRFAFRTLPASEFPALPVLAASADATVVVAGSELTRCARNSKAYRSGDRYAPTMIVEDGRLVVYASDGASVTRTTLGAAPSGWDEAVSFDDGLLRVIGAMRIEPEQVTLELSKTSLAVRIGDTLIAAARRGEPVETQRLCDEYRPAFVVGEVALLHAGLRRFGTSSFGAKVRVTVGDGFLRVATSGEGRSFRAPASGALDEVHVYVAPLLDALSPHICGEVSVEVSATNVLRMRSSEADTYVAFSEVKVA